MSKVKNMKYTPSSELQRESEQLVNNEKRLQAYRFKTTMNVYKEKKGELDVSCDNEPDYYSGQASETMENQLKNDPGYQEFINNVNKSPF